MSDIVSPLFQWLNTNPELAGLATFAISAAESVAVIGTVVPGSITMTAIGTLAGAGVIPLWGTILWAMLGAVIGDSISYWIGHYFKDRIRNLWPFRDNPSVLHKGENFVRKYGVMSVFIGRFVGPVRALVPVVAGMLGMKPLQFSLANILSAIGWAPAYMLPGILLGAASLELPPDIALHVMLAFLLSILLVILCFWFAYKMLQLIHLQIDQMQNTVWQWFKKSRWLSFITHVLKHHDRKREHGQLNATLYLGIILLGLALLCVIVKTVGADHLMVNDVMYHLARGIRNPVLDNLMINITLLGQSQILLPVIVVIAGWLVIRKRFRAATHVVLLSILTAGGVAVVKNVVQSPRPWGIANQAPSFSMPSGHTTLAMALYVGLAYLMSLSIREGRRFLVYVPAFIVVLAVSLSRIYLGAHWFTDTVAGWLLGGATLIAVVISYERRPERPLKRLPLFLVAFITLCFSYGYYHHQHFEELQDNHVLQNWPIVKINETQWWKTNNDIPADRTSLFGFRSQRVNVEWAGNIDAIRTSLTNEGWTRPPVRDLASTLHRIADVSSTQYLPLISPQYLDKKPALIMTRLVTGTKQLLVIRLWDSSRVLDQTGESLWVGFVGAVPRSYSWIVKKHPGELEAASNLIFPVTNVADHWEWKLLKPNTRKVLLIRSKRKTHG